MSTEDITKIVFIMLRQSFTLDVVCYFLILRYGESCGFFNIKQCFCTADIV